MSVLNIHVVHDKQCGGTVWTLTFLILCMDYIDSVMARYEKINYLYAIEHVVCCMCTLLASKVAHHKHIACLKSCTRMQLKSFTPNFSSDSTHTHAAVKFKLSCTASS